jgi:Niemann-Pick C1 protein
MTLDCKREISKRYNILCCIKSVTLDNDEVNINQSFRNPLYNDNSDENSNKNSNGVSQEPDTSFSKKQQANTSLHVNNIENETSINEKDSGLLFRFFKNYYAPLIMHKGLRPIIFIIFIATLFTSLSFLPKVHIGLDQKLSMPKDSYVLDYFKALEKYLSVGVPVYFVVKSGVNYADVNNQNLICSTSGCNEDSLLSQIYQESLEPDYSSIAISGNSWLDDYFDWLSSGGCCLVYKNDTNKFCPASTENAINLCMSCPYSIQNDTNRPIESDFYKYLRFYLIDNPGPICAKGGHAAYGEAVEILNKPDGSYSIGASSFMAYHKVGVTSADFIQSLKKANEIALNITNTMKLRARSYSNDTKYIENLEVFPYR